MVWFALLCLPLASEVPAVEAVRVEGVVMVARHGTRGPYGLMLDNPSEEELQRYAPNTSFAVSREAFRIESWQALTPGGADQVRHLAQAAWRRYRQSLFGNEEVPSCAQLRATPDVDVRNLQSSAHFMGVLVGGGSSVLQTPADVAAAAAYGSAVGRCANLTHPPPPHVLRQGGPALEGLPPTCGTASEHQLRALSRQNQPHLIKLRHARQVTPRLSARCAAKCFGAG